MRILLDTHLMLWAITGDARLGKELEARLLDPANEIHISAASIWEIGIKHAKNPAVMPISADVAAKACVDSDFQWLDITVQHAQVAASLPPLHLDPFDRMLVAQAIQEPLVLLTRDPTLPAYSELVKQV
jgi:PIN domain nuclease of toxin-antitoxin system